MLSCKEAGRLADAFVDRELLAAARLKVLEHIRACRDCAALIEEKAQLKRLIREQLRNCSIVGSN